MSTFGKQLNKQLKSKQLSKLKYYCQICEKQCRDDNGFRQHCKSPHHLKMKSLITKEDILKFNEEFEKSFLRFLRLSHGEKWVNANKAYNAFIIQEKDHVHMNSTKFTSLTKFIQHLGQTHKVKIQVENEDEFYSKTDDNDSVNCNSLMIAYIDNSSATILRKEQIAQLEKDTLSEQESQSLLLKRQIEKAQSLLNIQEGNDTLETLTEDNGGNEVPAEPIQKISLSSKSKVIKPKKVKKKNIFE